MSDPGSRRRSRRAPRAAVFGATFLACAGAGATPFIVPTGARQVEEMSGADLQLSGPCGPAMELNQPVRSGFYQGNGRRGGLVFEFRGTKLRGRAEAAVDLDLDQQVQGDNSFVLGGSATASGVTLDGSAVGNGSGSGDVAQGGFIFATVGSRENPEKGKVESLSLSFPDFGGIDGCLLTLSNLDIESLIPVAAGTIGATTPTAIAAIPGIQYQDVARGAASVRRVLGAALPLVPGSGAGARAEGIVPLAGGGLRYQGLAAGDGPGMPWGIWGNLELSFFEDNFAATAYDADRNAITVGADISPRENLIVGVALSFSDTEIDSTFNQGGGDVETLTVVPYLAMRLVDPLRVDYDLSVDVIGGYGDIDISQFRTIAGTRVSSSPNGRRWFVSGDVTGARALGDWSLTGTVGMLYANDRIDGFTESNGTPIPRSTVELGQFHVDGEVGYTFGRLTPFASLSYEFDFQREDLVTATNPQPENDSDGLRFGLGLRYYADDTWTGSLRWDRTLGRSDFDEDAFSFQLHASF